MRQGASQGYIRERWPVLISSSPFPKVCTLSNIHCTTPLASRSARLAESPPRFSTWKTWGQSLSKYPRGRAGSCATSVSRNNSYTQEASHRRSSPAFFYCFLIILLLTITLRSHLHTSFLDTCTASLKPAAQPASRYFFCTSLLLLVFFDAKIIFFRDDLPTLSRLPHPLHVLALLPYIRFWRSRVASMYYKSACVLRSQCHPILDYTCELLVGRCRRSTDRVFPLVCHCISRRGAVISLAVLAQITEACQIYGRAVTCHMTCDVICFAFSFFFLFFSWRVA